MKTELKNNITTVEELSDVLKLTDAEREKCEEIIAKYPMMITPYYFSLIDPEDPEDAFRIFCEDIREDSTWLDDELNAI